MKIINLEDDKEVVYVQANDLIYLMNLGDTIPAEVIENYFGRGVIIVNDDNRFEFIKFTNPKTVLFFKECNWIPDFKDFKSMTSDQIIASHQQTITERNNVAESWNILTDEERDEKPEIYDETLNKVERLEFKAQSIIEILWTKQGHRVMPFPIVPDKEGFTLDNEDCPYIAKQGVNPLQVLIYKKDGSLLTDKEQIPMGLVESATSLTIMNNLENNEYFGKEFTMERTLSSDKKYLITTFAIVPELSDEQKKQKESSKKADQPKSLRKRIKDWWNQKKSNN